MSTIGRRGFLRTAATAALGAHLCAGLSPLGPVVNAARQDEVKMPTRRLGRTGYAASVVGLGGMSTIMDRSRSEEAAAIINRALDLGVNYIDTADSYRDGESEANIGEVLRHRRDEVFLATKTRQQTADGLEEQSFNKSRERLQTDTIDLYFFHGVHTLEHLDAVLDRDNGAIRAFERLRDKGRIRYIGVSSHCSATLMEAMNRYDFDCVFVTLNPAGLNMIDPENLRAMLDMAGEKDVGTVGMKIISRGQVFERGINMEQAINYALSVPIATAVIGITAIKQVEENTQLARKFTPYSQEMLARLEETARA